MACFWRWLSFALILLISSTLHARTTYKVAMEEDDVVTRTLFDAVADKLNINIHYVYYPSFNAILNAVKTGESDFAANVTYTEARAQSLSFSSPTNIEYTYLYSNNNSTLDSVKTIGVPKGTIYGALVREHYPNIRQVEYRGHEHAKTLLESGEVEGVIDAINQLKPMLLEGYDAQLLNHQISIKPVSIVTANGSNQVMLERIESFVRSASIQKTLRESVKSYQFEIRQQALRRAVLDSGIDLTKVFRVKLDGIGQYSTYNSDGTVTGISADVVQQACTILLLKCDIVSKADETWESMYQDLLDKKIDILAPLVVSEQRKATLEFSSPYYFPEVVMVKREGYKPNVYSNVSELIVEQVGVVKGDFFATLLSQLLPNKPLRSYSHIDEIFTALLEGEVDYMAISRANFNKTLRESNSLLPLEEDIAIGGFYQSAIAVGFAKNETGKRVAALFSRAIKMIDTRKIIETYDYRPNWKATLQAEKAFASNTQILFGLMLSFLVLIAFYLHSQSNTDPLTRLKNRRSLHRRYRNGLYPSETLVYLDMNNFKQINDSYGHDIGDQVLVSVARHIEQLWGGRCYRIGGDEFILVGKISESQLIKLAHQLKTVEFTAPAQQITFQVSLAVGYSTSRGKTTTLQRVIGEADKAMYRDKLADKNADLEQKQCDNVVHYLN
ncbi:sensory box/GGDEF family protein [Vibrio orientalis CIP 102891 = ATCC 33934]|uniref:GGDEF domain protein n=1 Tax=Vibrio orientalis CIP 102891 = ATCC 33934 TaxID=675816 RepID=C9QIJ7_VIBOR|nr:GGDEF domain-containing protein [Vibrio orientalis]EEX92724.1 GGDEF domain protein [Vibrio orientalis CIP 102891 = ATCC 33934]EGU52510.1 sensory box/GGDEF family protein [Vibrio orientalis CIP 102891 = ATCC 33934]